MKGYSGFFSKPKPKLEVKSGYYGHKFNYLIVCCIHECIYVNDYLYSLGFSPSVWISVSSIYNERE